MIVRSSYSKVYTDMSIYKLRLDRSETNAIKQSHTHREQELLDLLHGVCHAQVGLWHRGKHLDEHMQLHRQVGVLWLATFPQPLLLEQGQHHRCVSKSNSLCLTLPLN